uniref:Ig-like domain-containing protein n=1 Tax=Balaenoptera musculus TaxID=9771 RepID=A0A8C0I7G1_BALMU
MKDSLLCVFPALTLCPSVFLTPMSGSTEEFFVIGPSDPIVAVLGGDTVLPCRVSPPISAEDMELRWFRSKFSEAVFIYQNRVERNEEQIARYVGRTSLVRDFLAQGEAAVRIQKVQVSDNGLYTCFFRKGGFYEEASLELKVAGVGSAPQVRITGPEEDGVRVVCTSSGWFPKPQVQWRDLSGEKSLAFSETHTQDAEDSSAGNVTCSVLNTVLGQEKAMAIFIPGQHSFLVIGPSEPIVAMLGADTVLPCRVSPAMSVENMEIRWFHSQFSDAVYVYQNGMEQAGEQLVDFKGRAELVKDYITEGRVAVRIHSLRVSDNGMYKCFFKKGSDLEEALLELKVISLGSGPHIFMVGPEDEGIRLKCTGKGWFPQPEIQWADAKGEKIPSLSEDETQDNDGLFQIEASLLVRDSSKTEVSCSMKNPFFGQEQVETIFIPGQCCSFGGQDRSKEGIFRTWNGLDLLGVCF